MSELPEPVGRVVFAENLAFLARMPSESVDLVYVDPPFNTGSSRALRSVAITRVPDGMGDRRGFQGRSYRSTVRSLMTYDDTFDDYLAFLEPRLLEARRILKITGSLYLHVDYREVHYCKILLDSIFGRECFLNEIIWAYDYGGRTTRKWPPKHDNILVYTRTSSDYYFDLEAAGRIPYMAPGLVGPEKAARGKLPTDTWWHTIVPTNGRERTGYPTQKPLGILKRIVAVSCPPGGLVVDFFAGSGTTGEAALMLGRRFILVDNNPQAHAVMRKRLSAPGVVFDDRPGSTEDRLVDRRQLDLDPTGS